MVVMSGVSLICSSRLQPLKASSAMMVTGFASMRGGRVRVPLAEGLQAVMVM